MLLSHQLHFFTIANARRAKGFMTFPLSGKVIKKIPSVFSVSRAKRVVIFYGFCFNLMVLIEREAHHNFSSLSLYPSDKNHYILSSISNTPSGTVKLKKSFLKSFFSFVSLRVKMVIAPN